MIRKRIQIGETAATIFSEERYIDSVIDGISRARSQIKLFASDHPEFLSSLEPVELQEDRSEIVNRMISASKRAGVGPMATVAGAIAEAGVRSAKEKGAEHCIVDNGGDIAMIIDHPVTIGILDSLDSMSIPTIEIETTDGEIRGLCTSSGNYGHSISLGRAEAVTVMARDPALADALATALGNICTDRETIRYSLERLRDYEEVLWAIVRADNHFGTYGDMPRMRFCRRQAGNLTVHSDFPAEIPINTS